MVRIKANKLEVGIPGQLDSSHIILFHRLMLHALKIWIATVAILCGVELSAQTLTGIVYDKLSNEPLEAATIKILGTVEGTTTNAEGQYILEDLDPGRTSITISFVGYKPVKITDIWIKSGIVTERDIYLIRRLNNKNEVVITAAKPVDGPGELSINEEQINRFAATYYDPARLITSSPDIAVTNDQNNQVSVRGLSPNYNIWRLEGAEIVNPNHLSNAGTFLDQPSATGGGVNMLSAQMLAESKFLYSTFDNQYGNSVGGVFDMSLKKGNKLNRTYTGQASLIGFDFATEGPFKEGGGATYAANYRYSFTGLLAQMGVDFSGESIGFQDLSISLNLPTAERASLKIFGVGGISNNDFSHNPLAESEILKDRKDIYYANKTGIIGAKYNQGFTNGNLTSTLVYSSTNNNRDQNNYALNQDSLLGNSQSTSNQSILSYSLNFKKVLGKNIISVGLMANRYQFDYSPGDSDEMEYLKSNLLRPYIQLHKQLLPSVLGQIGLATSITKNSTTFEPRLMLNWQLAAKHDLGLAIGRYAQLVNPLNYYFSNPFGGIPDDFSILVEAEDFIRSDRVSLNHTYESEALSIKSEIFNYYFPKVNKLAVEQETVKANTYGISALLDKAFTSDYYARFGFSLFNSKIGGIDHSNNFKFSINIAAGKEWDFSNPTKSRVLSLNFRGMYQGGNVLYRSSGTNPGEAFIYEERNYYVLKPFLRFDVRLVWTSYKKNCTMSLSLDLQNVANIQNEAFQKYNPYTKAWEMQYQLGIIPILAYRVEW